MRACVHFCTVLTATKFDILKIAWKPQDKLACLNSACEGKQEPVYNMFKYIQLLFDCEW